MAEHDDKLAMAMELDQKVLRCVRDQYANYVIQKCIKCVPSSANFFTIAGGAVMVKKFATQTTAMSYHKYASNVIDKLTFGCHHDRQLITSEITAAGGGQHSDHINHGW